MAKKKKKTGPPHKMAASVKEKPIYQPTPWISMRTGVIIVGISSLIMAALTAYSAYPAKGLVDSILLGLLFGGMIWAVFLGNILINRILRRKR